MLLKSWARPPARVPMASIFCDWRSWRSRDTSRVMFSEMVRMPTTSSFSLRRGTLVISSQTCWFMASSAATLRFMTCCPVARTSRSRSDTRLLNSLSMGSSWWVRPSISWGPEAR